MAGGAGGNWVANKLTDYLAKHTKDKTSSIGKLVRGGLELKGKVRGLDGTLREIIDNADERIATQT